ncbi:uncharacterized protein [Palaemon carinicauda]|uniref:uncharacterized protein n=1 Tax=Palaemon carinicauda TaxID=392227 RepID=UPI0035B689CE
MHAVIGPFSFLKMLKLSNIMATSLVLIAFLMAYAHSAPAGEEDIRTGIMFNQLAIADLVKQQNNFEDVRNQIASMSSSLVTSQSFILGFLENVSNRIETRTGSIDVHLQDSKQLMESLAAIVMMSQEHQHNLTIEMRKAVQEISRNSDEQLASLKNILQETNAKLGSIEDSVRSIQIPSVYNQTKEDMPTQRVNQTESFCPPHFFISGNECYYVVKKRMMWEEARRECQNLNMNEDIPYQDKDEEIEFVPEIVWQRPSYRWKRNDDLKYRTDLAEPKDFPKLVESLREFAGTAGDNFWVGGFKEGPTWKWLGNSEISRSLWIRGYPRSRDRVALMRRRAPYLSSRTGRQRNPAICELTKG